MKKKIWNICRMCLIVLLILAIPLLTVMALPQQNLRQTPWLSRILRPFAGVLGMAEADLTYTAQAPQRAVTAAAQPIAITVHTEDGRTTFRQDFAALDDAYSLLGGLLAQALDTAGEPKNLSREDALQALSGCSAAFCFPCEVEPEVLSAWLSVHSPDCDGAMWYILCAGEQTTSLILLSEPCISMETDLPSGQLEAALQDVTPDGSFFAFESGDEVYASIDPLSLICETSGDLRNAVWSNPCEARWISSLASALDFNPYGDARYIDQNGTTSFTDQRYTLRVTGLGNLTLEILQEDDTFQSASESACDRIEAARRTVESIAGDTLGDARLLLTGYESTEAGAVCTFSYYLSGIPVANGSNDFAQVQLEGKQIKKVYMTIRTYQLTEEIPAILPAQQAASILNAGEPLQLIYAEQPEGSVLLNWQKK